MEKMEAHEKGLLHRAFSIFIFNDQNQMMIHQRALDKYHSPGLWTNACCSHQQPNETNEHAAHRRLMEEMGFDCELTKEFEFTYKAEFSNGLIEHEYDHVFTGIFHGVPNLNKQEVNDWKWVDLDELEKMIFKNPEKFTPWFLISWQKVVENRLKKTA
jgi:isopentenyl-diphosphate delta-isomerase